jgi:hypothetical protein
MQYIYDPWGHVIAEHMPDRSNIAGQVFARSAKYLFGTHSWGVPPIGYFWFDNAFRRSTAQRSQMEQEASRHSGDTYCPLGTRHGDTPFIGDVARYWVTLTGATRNMSGTDAGGLVLSNLQDAPGVSIQQGVPAAPGVPIRPGPRLTIPTGIAAAAPAFCVTDANGDFSAISSSAWVPVSAQLERSAGFSFAFTRPAGGANFRVTSIGIEGVAAAIDAQTEGAATLFFDQAPADVTVTAAGVLVSENMIFDVIPFQRVTFVAVPNGARHYRATVTRPGNLFDAADLVVTTRGSAGQEDIEISRFHAFDAATGRYASGIGPFHLPADIDIAVRRFQLRIGNTLSLRAPHTPNTETYSHRDPIVASAKPGAILFLLVPSAITPGAPTSAFAGTPPLTPDIVPAAAASDAEVIAFLGDGGALKVTLPADQPPEATADLTITLQVGPVGGAVPLTVVVSVEPHFTLDGGAAAAAGATVVLSSSDGTNLAEAGARPAEIADIAIAGAQATITLAATAASGTTVTLLLADANNSGRKARRILTVS